MFLLPQHFTPSLIFSGSWAGIGRRASGVITDSRRAATGQDRTGTELLHHQAALDDIPPNSYRRLFDMAPQDRQQHRKERMRGAGYGAGYVSPQTNNNWKAADS
jgi:hypothetical protein